MATKKFNVWTPTARSINPITMTNWEQVGVMPDIKTTADEAFKTAYVKVLELLISKNATLTDYSEILDRIKNSN